MSIRNKYETFGASAYYQNHASDYHNPHEQEISTLIRQNLHRMDTARVLDFSAGGGEVSTCLLQSGVTNIEGADPFTQNLYTQHTGLTCHPWSFDDVVRHGLPQSYSTIICSFALHLCPENQLFSVTWNLLQAAPLLVIITPHKRPELEKLSGISLCYEDHTLTKRGKRVRLKAYSINK
jgi:2-polyprenyl-3-methyl-5-hydroxy-6-metoxy-1,4-benzoquinol methylase